MSRGHLLHLYSADAQTQRTTMGLNRSLTRSGTARTMASNDSINSHLHLMRVRFFAKSAIAQIIWVRSSLRCAIPAIENPAYHYTMSRLQFQCQEELIAYQRSFLEGNRSSETNTRTLLILRRVTVAVEVQKMEEDVPWCGILL